MKKIVLVLSIVAISCLGMSFSSQAVPLDEWLPTPGNINVTIDVTDALGGPPPPLTEVRFSVNDVTNWPGRYTNDETEIDDVNNETGALEQDGIEDPDFDVFSNFTAVRLPLVPLQIFCEDYGGRIIFDIEIWGDEISGGPLELLTVTTVTIPTDRDNDKIADFWEELYDPDPPNLNSGGEIILPYVHLDLLDHGGDIDSSIDPGDPAKTGDDLTNFEEYRGFKWGQLGPKVSGSPVGEYQTDAFEPLNNGLPLPPPNDHFRTHPTQLETDLTDPGTKDLFVYYTGYDTTYRFAIGTAFDNGGVDVHVMDAVGTSTYGTANIDLLPVTNSLTGAYNSVALSATHTLKVGFRGFQWHTKAESATGTSARYAQNCTTYETALNNYFNDRYYLDGGFYDVPGDITPNFELDSVLGPLVQDKNDNGLNDFLFRVRGVKHYEHGIGAPLPLDGDVVVLGDFAVVDGLSVFDVDDDGKVENPVVASVAAIGTTTEYTKNHARKHSITHEMGHACGLSHNSVLASLMYSQSYTWSRDNLFSPDSLAEMKIHNDIDGDIIGSHIDNCPSVDNPLQIDADGDGFGNACDNKPLDPNKH